jgi:RNA polymerase sigma factor (sigma-70 family)
MNNEKGEPLTAASAIAPFIETSAPIAQLFRDHHRRVLVAAYRITGDMADAEDIAQSVFLRIASGDAAGMKNAPSYLYRAAINGALDLLRRRKTAGTEPLDVVADVVSTGAGAHPEAEASGRELRAWLRAAIAELPARAAEMFTLRYIEDLGNREIAAMMGTSQAVVAVTLHNARSRLRKRLAEFERREG